MSVWKVAATLPLPAIQGMELKSMGGDEHTKDSFTSRTKMVLSSLQTNFAAAAEQGSVKKRRLSSSLQNRAPEVIMLSNLVCTPYNKDFAVRPMFVSLHVTWLSLVSSRVYST